VGCQTGISLRGLVGEGRETLWLRRGGGGIVPAKAHIQDDSRSFMGSFMVFA
jgi:hypothetical protein